MPGVVFFDQSRRLCMTIDEDTLRPGGEIRAVPWLAGQQRWGPPLEVACTRLARLADLSDEDLHALEVPAKVRGDDERPAVVRALYPPGPRRQSQP
jgi:hypothetical protein